MTQTFIKMLLKTIQAVDGRDWKKGKSNVKELMRPIICICNDPYAPVLSALRPHAQIFFFKPPNFQTLAKRLTNICEWQGLKADLRSMLILCELVDGDMRSALNTLQFLGKKHKRITHENLVSTDVGSKDVSHDWLFICNQIFHIPTSAQQKSLANTNKGILLLKAGNSSYVTRINNLIQGSGQHDKILQGCFENYLNSKAIDVSGPSNTESLFVQQGNFLHFYDQLQKQVYQNQAFQLMQYLAYPIVQFHALFATSKKMVLEFPRADYKSRTTQKQVGTVCDATRANMQGSNQVAWFSRSLYITELCPFLIQIIAPELRPVNVQMMKPGEIDVFMRLVEVMHGFGLKLVQEKVSSGGFLFRVEPYLIL